MSRLKRIPLNPNGLSLESLHDPSRVALDGINLISVEPEFCLPCARLLDGGVMRLLLLSPTLFDWNLPRATWRLEGGVAMLRSFIDDFGLVYVSLIFSHNPAKLGDVVIRRLVGLAKRF